MLCFALLWGSCYGPWKFFNFFHSLMRVIDHVRRFQIMWAKPKFSGISKSRCIIISGRCQDFQKWIQHDKMGKKWTSSQVLQHLLTSRNSSLIVRSKHIHQPVSHGSESKKRTTFIICKIKPLLLGILTSTCYSEDKTRTHRKSSIPIVDL